MVSIAQYQVRPMTEADIAQVADIERESFPTTWPRTAYRREISNRLARYLVVIDRTRDPLPPATEKRRGLMNLIRRRDDEIELTTEYIVGYVGIWLMVDEAHIVAIAVRESHRRKGIGELLLIEAIDIALENHQESMSLEVRRSNLSAQALYEKYRFLKVGVRKRYYSDDHEDAIIMSTPPIQDKAYLEYLDYMREAHAKRWSRE